MGVVDIELHPALLNWADQHSDGVNPEFESLIADGLRRLLVYGNSSLLQLSSSLSQLKCLGRFHDGDGGVFAELYGARHQT